MNIDKLRAMWLMSANFLHRPKPVKIDRFSHHHTSSPNSEMEKPHKEHHKPSAGSKLAKKDAAKGVDRSGGKNYNPKVSLSRYLKAQSSAHMVQTMLERQS